MCIHTYVVSILYLVSVCTYPCCKYLVSVCLSLMYLLCAHYVVLPRKESTPALQSGRLQLSVDTFLTSLIGNCSPKRMGRKGAFLPLCYQCLWCIYCQSFVGVWAIGSGNCLGLSLSILISHFSFVLSVSTSFLALPWIFPLGKTFWENAGENFRHMPTFSQNNSSVASKSLCSLTRRRL